MNLESVLGESLQHYGIKRNVSFTNRTGSGNGSMIACSLQMEWVKL